MADSDKKSDPNQGNPANPPPVAPDAGDIPTTELVIRPIPASPPAVAMPPAQTTHQTNLLTQPQSASPIAVPASVRPIEEQLAAEIATRKAYDPASHFHLWEGQLTTEDNKLRIVAKPVETLQRNKPKLIFFPGRFVDHDSPEKITATMAIGLKNLGGRENGVSLAENFQVFVPSYHDSSFIPEDFKRHMIETAGPVNSPSPASPLANAAASTILGHVRNFSGLTTVEQQATEINALQRKLGSTVLFGQSAGSHLVEHTTNAIFNQLTEKGYPAELVREQIMPHLQTSTVQEIGLQQRPANHVATGATSFKVNSGRDIALIRLPKLGLHPHPTMTQFPQQLTALVNTAKRETILQLNPPNDYLALQVYDPKKHVDTLPTEIRNIGGQNFVPTSIEDTYGHNIEPFRGMTQPPEGVLRASNQSGPETGLVIGNVERHFARHAAEVAALKPGAPVPLPLNPLQAALTPIPFLGTTGPDNADPAMRLMEALDYQKKIPEIVLPGIHSVDDILSGRIISLFPEAQRGQELLKTLPWKKFEFSNAGDSKYFLELPNAPDARKGIIDALHANGISYHIEGHYLDIINPNPPAFIGEHAVQVPSEARYQPQRYNATAGEYDDFDLLLHIDDAPQETKTAILETLTSIRDGKVEAKPVTDPRHVVQPDVDFGELSRNLEVLSSAHRNTWLDIPLDPNTPSSTIRNLYTAINTQNDKAAAAASEIPPSAQQQAIDTARRASVNLVGIRNEIIFEQARQKNKPAQDLLLLDTAEVVFRPIEGTPPARSGPELLQPETTEIVLRPIEGTPATGKDLPGQQVADKGAGGQATTNDSTSLAKAPQAERSLAQRIGAVFPEIKLQHVSNKAIAWQGLGRGLIKAADGKSTPLETGMTGANGAIVASQEMAEIYNARALKLIESARNESQAAAQMQKLNRAFLAAETGKDLARFSNIGGKTLGAAGAVLDVNAAVQADNNISRAGHIANAGLGTSLLFVESGPAGWVIGTSMFAIGAGLEIHEAKQEGVRRINASNQQVLGEKTGESYVGNQVGVNPGALKPQLNEFRQLDNAAAHFAAVPENQGKNLKDPTTLHALLTAEIAQDEKTVAVKGENDGAHLRLVRNQSALKELGTPGDYNGKFGEKNEHPTYASRVLKAADLKKTYPQQSARVEAWLDRLGDIETLKNKKQLPPERLQSEMARDLKDVEKDLQALQKMPHEQRDATLRGNEKFLREAGIPSYSPLASALPTYTNLVSKAALIGVDDLKKYGFEREVKEATHHTSEQLQQMMGRLQAEGKIEESRLDFLHPIVNLNKNATAADRMEYASTLHKFGIDPLATVGQASQLDSELMHQGNPQRYPVSDAKAYQWAKAYTEMNDTAMVAEKAYLEHHPAAAQSVNAGLVGSGLEYFARIGMQKGESYGGVNAQTIKDKGTGSDQSEYALRTHFREIVHATVQQLDQAETTRQKTEFNAAKDDFMKDLAAMKGKVAPGSIAPVIEEYRDALKDVSQQPTDANNVATKALYFNVELSSPAIGLLPPKDTSKTREALQSSFIKLDSEYRLGTDRSQTIEGKPALAIIIDGAAKEKLVQQLSEIGIRQPHIQMPDHGQDMSTGSRRSHDGGVLIQWEAAKDILAKILPQGIVTQMEHEAKMSHLAASAHVDTQAFATNGQGSPPARPQPEQAAQPTTRRRP